MCGITGILAFNESGRQHLHQISAATYCLIRRGPDDEGLFLQDNAALGHRRLSVIDTSGNAAQPFTDSSGRFTIVFNGEIFNFKELRSALMQKGLHFRSKSDTEVLLQLFISEGASCLASLDGEFAFAVYDKEKEELFLARDRFGIKPLYYYCDSDRFVFGSELNALLAFDVPKVIDKASLQLYLHLNYIPGPWSIFENVRKLESGCYLYADKRSATRTERYYSIPGDWERKAAPDYASAKAQLRNALETSVSRRMIADVPLGCFLSGGIDSSIITAIASRLTPKLHTFSVGFRDEPYFDETSYALLVAKKFNTEHTVFSLGNDDLLASLHELLQNTDEPFADSSALAVNLLSKHTRKHVTVALSGDGADELFGGYNKHEAELRARHRGLKASLVSASYPFLKQLPKSRNSRSGNIVRQLVKFAEGLRLEPAERYWRWAGFSGADELLLHKDAQTFGRRKSKLLEGISGDLNSVFLTDMHLVLENDMLVKTDRMSMSQGLEVRVPFLSQEVVDLAFSCPASYKIGPDGRKKILKDAFREDLPEELIRRGKQGFEVPLLKWMRTELRSLITEDLLSDRFIREQGLFDPEGISRLKATLFSNDPDDSAAKVWALIVFQHWWKRMFQ